MRPTKLDRPHDDPHIRPHGRNYRLGLPGLGAGPRQIRRRCPRSPIRKIRKPRRKTCSAARPRRRRSPRAPSASIARLPRRRDRFAGNGPSWQVMRLSRNRNWGHPELVKFLERFAKKVPQVGWPGLLVGDMAQARGGPMLTGHASHQLGLDADIWLTPMPNRELSRLEREEMSAIDMVRPDKRDIDPIVWTPAHTALIRAAALEPRSNASWSMPRSRRRCAGKRPATAPGCARCARGGAQLSYASAGRLPGRKSRMQVAGPDAGSRRLRRRSRLLVQGRHPQSAAAERTAEAEAAADHGGFAAGL